VYELCSIPCSVYEGRVVGWHLRFVLLHADGTLDRKH
jgi:hypothetical protein